MKLEFLLAAAIWLAVPLSQPAAAQDKGGPASRASTVMTLRDVQKALHATENAQVQLLAAGTDAKVLADVNHAVRRLTVAREILRSRLEERLRRQ